MKTLVLAEKPSVGRELARVLKCDKKTKTYIEGSDYIVTWALGHLVELAGPDSYDVKLKKWSLDTLPMLPEHMKHKVIKKSGNQFRSVKQLMLRNDVNHLIVATDAGREGELVARWIMMLAGWKKDFSRLWISSQTDGAIKEGFKNLKPGRDYDRLLMAAECRAEADWIVGLNVTRALTCKYDMRLSAGRVQTPTLGMIVNREKEIEDFTPTAFWTLNANFGAFDAVWRSSKGNERVSDEDYATTISDKCNNTEAEIVEYTEKESSEKPPLAYDLTTLQQDGDRLLGFSAKETLRTLQGLYERHKIVSYPRTDSKYITEDIVPTLKNRLLAIKETRFNTQVSKLLSGDINPGKRLVDSSKVGDHHAIIPTEEKVNESALSREEKMLWDLIVKRYLTVLSKDSLSQNISVVLKSNGELFYVKGKKTIKKGWREIENVLNDSSQNLSGLKVGDKVLIKSLKPKRGLTSPPSRFTEGTLLEAMNNPIKYMKDKTLKESLSAGLGTPATRADLIEKLFSSYYMEKKGKFIYPTPQGEELLTVVPDLLKFPDLTASWEKVFENIALGKSNSGPFLKEIREQASLLITEIKNSSDTFEPSGLSKEVCPMCGKNLLSVHDKKGNPKKVCRSMACGYEESTGKKNRKDFAREKSMGKRLINQYSDQSSDTMSLGDILKAAMDKK